MSVDKLKQIVLGVTAVSLFLMSGIALADYMNVLNLTEGVTPTSKMVYSLHMQILYIVTVIGILVFSVMCWSIYHHRKSKGAVAEQFHHSTAAEITWTVVPILILVLMAIPATKALVFMEQTGDSEMTIKVTGYQWKWKYDYLDEDISFFSALAQDSNDARQRGSGIDPNTVDNYLLDVDNRVVLPIKTKIRILTTAADVIHDWWVPALGWKRDAIPGFINDNWTYIEEPGVYRGKCAELCGKDHGFMPIVVEAVSKDEYVAWVYYFFISDYDFLNNFDLYLGFDNLMNLFSERSFLILFWSHFLVINLFCGSWIVKDSQQLMISKYLVFIPLVLTYFVGPLGILFYWIIRIFFAKNIRLF